VDGCRSNDWHSLEKSARELEKSNRKEKVGKRQHLIMLPRLVF
jgi:hypothetical protein